MKIPWEWEFRLQVYISILAVISLWIVAEKFVPHYHTSDVAETARLIADDLAKKCREVPPYAINSCFREVQEQSTSQAEEIWEKWRKKKQKEWIGIKE